MKFVRPIQYLPVVYVWFLGNSYVCPAVDKLFLCPRALLLPDTKANK